MSLGFATITGYSLKLASADDIKARSVKIYSYEEISKDAKDDLNDRAFGPRNTREVCGTCENSLHTCPGHAGAIRLPVPIVNPIVSAHVSEFIQVLCPNCSRVVIPDNLRTKVYALSQVREYASTLEVCPMCRREFKPLYQVPLYCKGKIMYSIFANFSSTKVQIIQTTNRGDVVDYSTVTLVDNRKVWAILSAVPKEDCELLGYHPEAYHPYRYMTDHIPIMPDFVRPKNSDRGGLQGSKMTKFYLRAITISRTIAERLSTLGVEKLDGESKALHRTDMETLAVSVALIMSRPSKADAQLLTQEYMNSHDISATYVDSMGEKGGLFRQYILGSVHDQSGRAVISPGPELSIGTASIPKLFATKICTAVTVTQRNIDHLRQLVLNGKNKYPGATRIEKLASNANAHRSTTRFTIDESSSEMLAASLMPGDIIYRHLVYGDICTGNRYPSLRPESTFATVVKITPERTISLTVSNVYAIGGDFDGDEAQIHVPSCYYIKAEAFILQSSLAHLIAPKDGRPAIYVADDAGNALHAINKLDKIPLLAAQYIIKHGYTTKDIILDKEYYTVNELLSHILPKGLYFKGKSCTIIDGVIVDGKFNEDLLNSKGELIISMASCVGAYRAIRVMEDISRFAYAFNRIIGQTMGCVLRISKETDKLCQSYINKRIESMNEYIRMIHAGTIRYQAGQNPAEYNDGVLRLLKATAYATEIQDILRKELISNRLNDLYFRDGVEAAHMLVSLGQVNAPARKGGETRPEKTLAWGSRALATFSRYEDTAESTGYIRGNQYIGLKQFELFFDSIEAMRKLFEKGARVAIPGYAERKAALNLGPIYVGNLGEVMGDAHSYIDYTYGTLGTDTRAVIKQKIPDITMSDEDFISTYSLNDGSKECTEELARMHYMRDMIRSNFIRNQQLTDSIISSYENYTINSPVDFDTLWLQSEHFIDKSEKRNSKPASVASIWKMIRNLEGAFILAHARSRIGAFFRDVIRSRVEAFEIIYRFKLTIKRFHDAKFTEEQINHLFTNILDVYANSLAPPGEAAGVNSSLNFIEPITQQMLKSIHKTGAGGSVQEVIKKDHADKISEIIESKRQSIPVITACLKDRFNQAAAIRFAKEITRVYLHETLITAKLIVSRDWEVLPEDKDFPQKWKKFLTPRQLEELKNANTSCFKLQLLFSNNDLVANRVSPSDIAMLIQRKYNRDVEVVAVVPTLEPIVKCYVFFKYGISKSSAMLIASELTTSTVVRGNPYIYNATVIKVLNDFVIVDEETEGYDAKKKGVESDGKLYKKGAIMKRTSYKIEANSVPNKGSFLTILEHPDVDQSRCHTGDFRETIEIFGLIETRHLLIDQAVTETQQMSEMVNVNLKHVQIFVDYITYRGVLASATRHSLKSNPRADAAQKMAFEEAPAFLKEIIKTSDVYDISAPVPSIFYGVPIKMGTAMNKVLMLTSALGKTERTTVIKEFLTDLRKGKKVKPKPKPSSKKKIVKA